MVSVAAGASAVRHINTFRPTFTAADEETLPTSGAASGDGEGDRPLPPSCRDTPGSGDIPRTTGVAEVAEDTGAEAEGDPTR